jgi:hypothetical protein
MSDKPTTMLDMVCTCEADGERATEDLRRRIFDLMGLSDMGQLTTAILLSLAFDFNATACIAGDMWFGVYVSTPDEDVDVECDNPADGSAAAWSCLAAAYPERVSVSEEWPSQTEERAAQAAVHAVADALLATFEKDDAAYRAHREAAHDGPNDCPPCEPCSTLRDAMVQARIELENAWGARALDDAVEAAYR